MQDLDSNQIISSSSGLALRAELARKLVVQTLGVRGTRKGAPGMMAYGPDLLSLRSGSSA
jgi:hypothetical protein